MRIGIRITRMKSADRNPRHPNKLILYITFYRITQPMSKKESYRHILPHFQQSGQAYFITWNLKDAVPPKALKRYSSQLEILKSQIDVGAADSYPLLRKDADLNPHPPGVANSDSPEINANRNSRHPNTALPEIEKLRKEYYSIRKKYIKAYNHLLDAERNPTIDLSKPENTQTIIETLKFSQGKRLENFTFCIMPNHVHWVFQLFENDELGKPVYLEDILYSVKRFSASQINKLENRKGSLWQKESFDTTIRDEKHLYYTIEYTLNNPVKAGFVKDWKEWPGSWSAD